MSQRILVVLAVLIAVGSVSCSSPRQVEEFLPVQDACVFWDGAGAVRTGLLCKQTNDGSAVVAIIVRNRGGLPLEIQGQPTLIVDGKIQEKGEKLEDARKIVDGKAFVHRFSMAFREYDVKSLSGHKGQPIMVSAEIGTFHTPTVIIHLSTDNMLPFRFANPLD